MARIKLAGTSGASENSIVFLPAGGHSHNGQNSSLIDSTAYSVYDFSPTFVGTEINPERAQRQENNRIALEDLIKRVVNNSVLQPAGIRLEPGSLNGSLIIANTITAGQLAANTITAQEIAANTITANELASNIVLINNRITSSNWNGTIQANGTIFSNGIGTTGWAITNTHAVFDSTLIRGSIAANSLLTPGLTIYANGAISSTNFSTTADGSITASNANLTGTLTSSAGTIGGWTIQSNRLYAGSTYLYSNGYISVGSGTFSGTINASGGTFSGSITASGTISGGTISGATVSGSTISGAYISGGRFDSGYVYMGNMSHINSYYHGIDLGGGFTNCFLRGDGGEIFFRVDNGSQWMKFENGTIYINATNFSVSPSGATFSGALSGASGSVGANFSIGDNLYVGNYVRINGPASSNVTVTKIRGIKNLGDSGSNGTWTLVLEGPNGTNKWEVRDDGLMQYRTQSAYSDIRIKNNIKTSTLGLDFINSLKPRSYNLSLGENENGVEVFKPVTTYGFVAQEVKEAYEKYTDSFDGWGLSIPDDENSLQTVSYDNFIAPIVKAIQELSDKIEALENKGV